MSPTRTVRGTATALKPGPAPTLILEVEEGDAAVPLEFLVYPDALLFADGQETTQGFLEAWYALHPNCPVEVDLDADARFGGRVEAVRMTSPREE